MAYQVERSDVLLSVQLILTREEEARQLGPPAPRPAPTPEARRTPVVAAPRPAPAAPAWVRRAEAARSAEVVAMVDPVTGAGTRDALRRDLELERAAAAAAPGPIVLVLRVAGLDQVRLTMGEPSAEAVLKSMVEVAPFALRARDRIYRSGPSEMVLLLPGADLDGANEARVALESALGKVLAGRGFPELRLEARALQPVAEAS